MTTPDKEQIIVNINHSIDQILGDELPVLTRIKHYTIDSGGKRIRSLVAYYIAEMYSAYDKGLHQDIFKISAIVEIIHAASLLHDDVLDDANTRRGKPSGKNIFGSKEVILGGDYMFATAIRSLNDFENPALMDIFTRVICDLSIAELMQLEYEKRPEITFENYLQIIYGKTGSLFQTACEGVAIHMKRPATEISHIAETGKNLGMLFQMRDDYLDYFNSALLNKPPYQDFENGLYTFPILLVRESMDEQGKLDLLSYFSTTGAKRKESEIVKSFLNLLESYDAKKICLDRLKEMETRLLEQIVKLPDHEYRKKIEDQIKKLMELE
jgi:octaprenyl-diphosphate synthase